MSSMDIAASPPIRRAETVQVSLLLAFAGGYLDAYTWNVHGECEHLAFRGVDTDWQIWIESGARPVPRKSAITSKTMAGAAQYTLRIKDWNTDAVADADAFVVQAAGRRDQGRLGFRRHGGIR